MGFETCEKRKNGNQQNYLKYPYGIWNSTIAESLEVEKLFEVSLWDLKPHGTRPGRNGYIYLKYPYGIWNFSLSIKSPSHHSNLKYPYGIWNANMVFQNLARARIWSIPMGFETG